MGKIEKFLISNLKKSVNGLKEAANEKSTKKEPKDLIHFREKHLKPTETVKAWAQGYIGELMGAGNKTQHNGVFIITEKKVFFYKKGFLGEVLQSIPIDKITSIERRSIMTVAVIKFYTSGDSLECKIIRKDQEAAIYEVVEAIREKVENEIVTTTVAGESAIDKIKKLAGLRDDGIITEEEFQEKKTALLSEV